MHNQEARKIQTSKLFIWDVSGSPSYDSVYAVIYKFLFSAHLSVIFSNVSFKFEFGSGPSI